MSGVRFALRFLPVGLGLLSIISCSDDPAVAKLKYFESSNAYVEQGKYREAIIEYRNAVQQEPTFGEARYQLAEAYVKLNDVRGALPEYIRAADLLPDHVEAQLKAGAVLLLTGRFDDAKARGTRVLELDSGNVDASSSSATPSRAWEISMGR